MICHLNLLEDSVQGNKCTRTANTGTVNITNWDSARLDLHSSGHISLWGMYYNPKFHIKVHLPSWIAHLFSTNMQTGFLFHSPQPQRIS
jgi:hypothetical protein